MLVGSLPKAFLGCQLGVKRIKTERTVYSLIYAIGNNISGVESPKK